MRQIASPLGMCLTEDKEPHSLNLSFKNLNPDPNLNCCNKDLRQQACLCSGKLSTLKAPVLYFLQLYFCMRQFKDGGSVVFEKTSCGLSVQEYLSNDTSVDPP